MTDKPQWNAQEECLHLDGAFYKVCLLQGYPDIDVNWVFGLTEAGIDLHISQVIVPKDTQKALDANKTMVEGELSAQNEKKSVEFLGRRIADLVGFRQYVSTRNVEGFDNAYIVTFTARQKHSITPHFEHFISQFDDRGLLRFDKDLQLEMFRVRLPGLGRNTLFSREDHSDTVAAMMPFTTYPVGSRRPEMLRVGATGNLVGFSPSKITVPHEMVVAETEGGKDTQFGMKVAETYPLIRYDFVELGNSYQGLI